MILQSFDILGRNGFRTAASVSARIIIPHLRRWHPRPAQRAYQSDQTPSRTALYDLHLAHGGKMVQFGGYEMPVQYKDQTISQSHLWTRQKASLFDVSHMLQHHFSGPGASDFLSRVTPSSVNSLKPGSSTLSCFLLPVTGGIVDDAIVTRLSDDLFYVVTNAGCREKDTAYLTAELAQWTNEGNPDVRWTRLLNNNLVAVQGPLAASIVNSVLADPADVNLPQLYFGHCRTAQLRLLDGSTPEVLLFRGGYTGEDGFEISLPENVDPHEVVNTLLKTAGNEHLRLAGLAARDTLRLEAGMCLYGNDMDETTTPVEASLGWIIGKDRREHGGFHGADTILPQLTSKLKGGTGVTRNRVGLVVEGAPARQGAELTDLDGQTVGVVTSGSPSPTLTKNIAMGYVRNGLHKPGTELLAVTRGKPRRAVVTKMPFVPTQFYRAS